MPNTYMVYSIVPMKPRKGYPRREPSILPEILWLTSALIGLVTLRIWGIALIALILC